MNEETKNDEKTQPKRKWLNYLIYPRFQASLILMNLFIFLGSLGVVYYQTYKSFSFVHSLAMQIDVTQDSTYFRLVGLQKELVFESILTSMILGSVLVLIFTLLFSHKSAGAVHRLKIYFLDIARNGHRRELDFRDGDMHGDLPEIVNSGIDRIKNDMKDEIGKEKE
jgi:hypothetical protein